MRIISKIDIKNDFVVKGRMYDGTRKISKLPQVLNYVEKFGIQELVINNYVSTLFGYDNFINTLKKDFQNIFLPITIAGGIRSLSYIEELFSIGADKIAINSYLFENTNIVKNIINQYGSQALASCVQTKKIDNNWFVFKDMARHNTGILLDQWLLRLQDIGIGEVYVINVDRDGTLKGIDISLLETIPKLVIPIIYAGGLKSYNDIDLIKKYTNVSGLMFSTYLYKNFNMTI